MSDIFAKIGLTISSKPARHLLHSFSNWPQCRSQILRSMSGYVRISSSCPRSPIFWPVRSHLYQNEPKFTFISETLTGGFDMLEEEMRIFKAKADVRGVDLPELPSFSTSLDAELAVDGAQLLAPPHHSINPFNDSPASA
ncbi:hypothetical protein V1527DRAFT_476411 [Lipomyces starkeyi]